MLNLRSYSWFWSNFGRSFWKHTGVTELDGSRMRRRRQSAETKVQCCRFVLVLLAMPPLLELACLAALQRTAFGHLWQVWLAHSYCLVTACSDTRSKCRCVVVNWRTVIACWYTPCRYWRVTGLVADWCDIANRRWCACLICQWICCSNKSHVICHDNGNTDAEDNKVIFHLWARLLTSVVVN